MGFLDWFKRKKVVGKQAVAVEQTDAPRKETLHVDAPRTKAGTANGDATRTTSAPADGKADLQAPCSAVTAAGEPCKNPAREGSKYCGRHKGYRTPGAATTRAKDTTGTKAPSGRRTHFEHEGYKLYQKGNRFNFSKKTHAEMKENGFSPVYGLPDGKTVGSMPNGVPVLKNK